MKVEECERGFDTLVVGAFLSFFLSCEAMEVEVAFVVRLGRTYVRIYVCISMTAEYIWL